MFFLRFGYFALLFLLIFFAFPPLIRCSLRSRLVGAVNREKESRFGSVPFLADVGINSVCLFHSHPFCRQRACALLLPHCITHFSVANLVCPVPEDVCGDTAFAEVCSPCARGCLHRDPAIRTDARISFVLLL